MAQASNGKEVPLEVNLSHVPSVLMHHVLIFLDFTERSLCCITAGDWQESCRLIDRGVTTLPIKAGSKLQRKYSPCVSRLSSLYLLDLMGVADDKLVVRLAELLPNLRNLSCVRSPLLTDRGLANLALTLSSPSPYWHHHERPSSLREIDLTGCHRTTYSATIKLRQALPLLELVRRQPRCFDGHFITPFGGGIEMHTYFADASFDFARESQSKGYVRSLKEHPDGFFVDSLQYSNFGERHGLPFFCKYLYRPGVALKQVADLDVPGPNGSVRNVLVAQALRGFKAPKEWPAIPDDDVPLGESIFVMADGTLLQRGTDMEEARTHGVVAMVSRMEVLPLESSMPPLNGRLIKDIETFEQDLLEWASHYDDETLEQLEEALHQAFGGPAPTVSGCFRGLFTTCESLLRVFPERVFSCTGTCAADCWSAFGMFLRLPMAMRSL